MVLLALSDSKKGTVSSAGWTHSQFAYVYRGGGAGGQGGQAPPPNFRLGRHCPPNFKHTAVLALAI